MKERILIVDDDPLFANPLMDSLRESGYEVAWAQTGADALKVVDHQPIGLTLLDLHLRGEDGLDLLPRLKDLRPDMSVIILTGYGTVDRAVEAMRRGADNFVDKVIELPDFLTIIEKELEAYQLRRKNAEIERQTAPAQDFVYSPGGTMSQILDLADQVAGYDTTVLLLGETGTGKDHLARRIHQHSLRCKGPFVPLNCARPERELAESELFGHERGSFTGAVARKIGLFEAADGGTLFLNEIAEVNAAVQAKLLDALENKQIRRVGSVIDIPVNVRLIVATNRDLEQEVADGRFREDLYYRLNVFTITLPPLRERREDIPLLTKHFLHQFCGAQQLTISSAAEEMLLAYGWKGNVRDLRNVIERATILCRPGSEILPAHLQPLSNSRSAIRNPQSEGLRSVIGHPQPGGDFLPLATAMDRAEREYLEAALNFHDWNLNATAQALDISRSTLYEKIKKHNLTPEE
jgi:DNA-binding NtrC family response regulator